MRLGRKFLDSPAQHQRQGRGIGHPGAGEYLPIDKNKLAQFSPGELFCREGGIPRQARVVKIENPEEIWLQHPNVVTLDERPSILSVFS